MLLVLWVSGHSVRTSGSMAPELFNNCHMVIEAYV